MRENKKKRPGDRTAPVIVGIGAMLIIALGAGLWILRQDSAVPSGSGGAADGIAARSGQNAAFPAEDGAAGGGPAGGGPAGGGQAAPATGSARPGVLDLNSGGRSGPLSDLMAERKREYGLEESVDAIVGSDEAIRVGDTVVAMEDILNQIRLESGGIVESDLAQPQSSEADRMRRLTERLRSERERFFELERQIDSALSEGKAPPAAVARDYVAAGRIVSEHERLLRRQAAIREWSALLAAPPDELPALMAAEADRLTETSAAAGAAREALREDVAADGPADQPADLPEDGPTAGAGERTAEGREDAPAGMERRLRELEAALLDTSAAERQAGERRLMAERDRLRGALGDYAAYEAVRADIDRHKAALAGEDLQAKRDALEAIAELRYKEEALAGAIADALGVTPTQDPADVPAAPNQVSSVPDQLADAPNQVPSVPDQLADAPNQVSSVPDQLADAPNQVPSVPDRVAAALVGAAARAEARLSAIDQALENPDAMEDRSRYRRDLREYQALRRAVDDRRESAELAARAAGADALREAAPTAIRQALASDLAAMERGEAEMLHALAERVLPAGGRSVYGIHVVRSGENIWNIHFDFLREYFSRRGIAITTAADEPDDLGRSSGIGKILKFSEGMVYIFNIREGRLSPDLNLIHPRSKIVVFNMGEALALLRRIDRRNIHRLHYDGHALWIPAG